MYCKVLNFVPILDLFYSISRKTFILYVSPRVEWIAQKISWRTFPSKANKHTTRTWGYGEENASKVLKRKVKLYIYIYVPSKKNTSTFFSFPAFHCLSIPIFNHFEPELVAGLAGKASRAPETVTLNIPKETNGAEKDEQDPKDLASRPEQWFKWWIEIMTMESFW